MSTHDKNEIVRAKLINTFSQHDVAADEFNKSSMLDNVETKHTKPYKGQQEDLHLDILHFVVTSSIELKDAINKGESSKSHWRNAFIIILLCTFGLSLIFVGFVTIQYGTGRLTLPLELVIGLFGTVIAQIISLLVLFVKFVNDVKYLKMYKAVTYKLLEYLIKAQPEKDDIPPPGK